MVLCKRGLGIILIFRRWATISPMVTSFMRGGRNNISSRTTSRIFMVLALRDSIVSFSFSRLIIDVAYQKSTGTITGWYYHKNSELYVSPRSPLTAETKSSHSRYSLSNPSLTSSITHEHKGRFLFTNFDDHGYKRIDNICFIGINQALANLISYSVFIFSNQEYVECKLLDTR